MIRSKVINTVLMGVVTIASLLISQINLSVQANSAQETPWTQTSNLLTSAESSFRENSVLSSSDHNQFTPVSLWSDNFSDGNGWDSSPAYYSTIQFPDINGDGKADMCGRGGAGVNCALSTGAAFGTTSIWSDNFSDGNGWDSSPAYYSTIQFPDINGDGKADMCGRGGAGVNCATTAASKAYSVYLPLITRQT